MDARRALWEGVRSFHADGGAVLLTSHYIEEVEALADRSWCWTTAGSSPTTVSPRSAARSGSNGSH
ncbi:hypothetical protein [Micromonospora sp. NBC_01739]|uniref:hypothetical protein n=1 Tax=Micromonospora sp. NBC_01739 TaxID=2975985 RepID=UPI002E12E9F7|nr:hypothetical protein OIE53_09305 [Micromonospora sp. NBC_01739]